MQIGLLYSIREIATNVLEIPTGIIADTIGRRRAMVFSFAAYLVSFLVFYFSISFSLFVAAMLFFSIGEAFRTGTHKAMILQYLKIKGWQDQKVFYYGHTRSASQMGSALSSLVAAALVFYSGSYQIIFLASTVPYVLDLLLMISYPRVLDGELSQAGADKIWHRFAKVTGEFIYSFKKPDVLRAIFNSAIYSAYYKSVKDFLQPVLQSFALSMPFFLALQKEKRAALVVGIIYCGLYLLTAYCSRSAGNFSRRFHSLNTPLNLTMSIGFAAGLLAGICYYFYITALAIGLYIIVYSLENLRRPLAVAYISETMDSNALASALSAESQVKTLLTAIIAPTMGYIADQAGVGIALALVSLTLIVLGHSVKLKSPITPI